MFIKEKSYDTNMKIRKYYIPVVLVILIIMNLTIVPSYLNKPIQLRPIGNTAIIQSSVSQNNLEETQRQIDTIDSTQNPIETPIIIGESESKPEPAKQLDPKKIEPESNKAGANIPEEENVTKKKKKKNLTEKDHNQSPSFRFSLFFYVIFVVGLMYSLISFNSYSNENFNNNNSKNNSNKEYKYEEKEYLYHEDKEEYDNL